MSAPTVPIVLSNPTDSTQELQRAIDAARETGGLGTLVRLPSGNYTVSSTLNIVGVTGLTIIGDGPQATTLTWKGDAASPMFLLNATKRCAIKDLAITVASGYTLLEGIRIQHNLSACSGDTSGTCVAVASSQALMRDLVIEGANRMGTGIRIYLYSVDNKNDHHRIVRCQIRDYTSAAIVIEGQASQNNIIEGCILQGVTGGQKGVDTTTIPGHGGTFKIFGGTFTQHQVADIDLGDRSGGITIIGCHSEQSARFLRALDYSGSDPSQVEMLPVTVEDIRWGADTSEIATDNEIIQFYASGPLAIRGCKWGGLNSPDNSFLFRFQPKNGIGGFIFENNVIATIETDGDFVAQMPDSFKASTRWRGTTLSPSDPMTPLILLTDLSATIYAPVTLEDWLNRGVVPPRCWWRGQETDGSDIFDLNRRESRFNLEPSGSPTYRNSRTGSTRYWLGFNRAAEQRFGLNDTGAYFNPQNISVAAMADFEVTAANADDSVCVLGSGGSGAGTGPTLRFAAGGKLKILIDGVTTTGTYNYIDGNKHRLLFIYDRTNSRCICVTDQETITGTYSATVGTTPNRGFGASANTLTSFSGYLIPLGWWRGTSAESLSAITIRQLTA